jgi:hypothetical protein
MVIGWKEGVWCILMPAILSVVAALVAGTGVNQAAPILRRALATTIWWLGLFLTLAAMSSLEWWSEEFPWKRSVWPLLVCGLIASYSGRNSTMGIAVTATIASISAWIILPTDESWKDMHPQYPFWSMAMVISCLWNTFSVQSVAVRNGYRWYLWIVVACLANVFVMAATSYSALANWALAFWISSLTLAVYFCIRPSNWSLSLAAPFMLFASFMTVTTALFSEERPVWIYAMVMFLPTIVVTIDYLAFDSKKTGRRVLTAAVISTALSGFVIWQLLYAGSAESW